MPTATTTGTPRLPVPERSATDALVWNVAGLLGQSAGDSRTFTVGADALDLGEDLTQARPLAGVIRVARTNRGILVSGRLATALEATCSRCLREIAVPIELALDEEVLPSIELGSGLPIEPGAEPEAYRLTEHHELDLEPIVREAIQLAEPIAPLCRPDCPGLCLVCGADLSAGPHGHEETELDPRLEALRSFDAAGGR